MAAYDVIENEYGKYGAYHTPDDLAPDEYYEPEFILDNRVWGTVEDITSDYLNGNFSYSDDFYALLHDVYGDYSEFPEKLKNDVEITRAAIKFNDDYSIEDLPTEAMEDKEIVMTLLDEVDNRSNSYDKYNAFMRIFNKGVGSDVLADKEVALRWVNHRPDNLQDLPPELRDDKEVVIAAVKYDSQALKYASDRLKDDIEVVAAALTETDCFGLMYASDRIKDNDEFVKMAMRKNDMYFRVASERIQNNPELVQTWSKDLIGKDLDEAHKMLGYWYICSGSSNGTHTFERSGLYGGNVTLKTDNKNIVTAVYGLDEKNKKWNEIMAIDRAAKKNSLDSVIKDAKNKAAGNRPDPTSPDKNKSR